MKIPKTAQIDLFVFILNIIYALYNAVLGMAFHSRWFLTLSAYYIILSVMRALAEKIRREKEKDLTKEFFVKRFIGAMLIILSLCLTLTVVLSVMTDRGVRYHEIVMITIALCTFIKITFAIINLIKSKKSPSPLHKAIKNIAFADALAAIFSLQRSMLVSFGEMSQSDIRLFNLLTGSGVSIIVLVLGLNLLGGKKIDMAKSKIVNASEKIAKGVVDGYKKIEKGTVDGYKKIEKGVVDGYTKIEDKFVDRYLTREGESVEDAKARLKNQNK